MTGGTGDGEKNLHIGVYVDIIEVEYLLSLQQNPLVFQILFCMNSKRITESFIIMSVGW